MGAIPDWYGLMRAARYLGVAPWDLFEQPAYWLIWATTAENAEREAQAARQEEHT